MTPLHIQILLHYSVSSEPYEMIHTNETRKEYVNDLIDKGLLTNGYENGYKTTDKGKFYITEGILKVPLPTQNWTIEY